MRRLHLVLVSLFAITFAPACAENEETPEESDVAESEQAATAFQGFRSPSGKIHCMASDTQLRCDVLSWGDRAMVIGAGVNSEARIVPATDTVAFNNNPVLAYDTPKTFGRFRCVVRKDDGMRCVGLKSLHGFEVSTQNKKTF